MESGHLVKGDCRMFEGEKPMKLTCFSLFMMICCSYLFTPLSPCSQDSLNDRPSPDQGKLVLYPGTLDSRPEIASPSMTGDGTEVLIARLKDGKYALVPVTIEHGSPLHYSGRVGDIYGKDNQLHVDRHEFPTFARTGLHSEEELKGKEHITSLPVSLITYIGRPGRYSGAGFMAADEDIISVLTGDNRLVEKLGLTHPRMARPLFHIWNLILKEKELGRLARFLTIPSVFYNGSEIALKAESFKGYQVSIFLDEVQGRFDISVRRALSAAEKAYLEEKYARLSAEQMAELQEKLSHIHFSEMAPYYIMRYGFYEGHTDYRADPIAIALVFGLRSLEEIEAAFPGKLYEAMTAHFASEKICK
jgi:hypothetical protein